MMGLNHQHQITPRAQITRRDLITLASVSFPLVAHIQRGVLTVGILEEFLSEVTASVTTSWYLFRSGGLTIVEYAVPQYLPELEELVKSSSLQRKRAAYLAAQGFLLLSFVAYNRLRFAEEIAHCQKAVTYAYESGDRVLLVESQRMLGSAFLDTGQLDKMLDAYLQAEHYCQGMDLPGFVYSKVQAKLSQGYAKHGKSQEVLRYRGEAERIFTEADDEIPVFLRTTHGRFQIILEEGRSTLDLGNHAKDLGNTSDALKYWKDAAEQFGKIEPLSSDVFVPLGTTAEIDLKRALAYAKARNMEGFLTAFPKGVQLAKELGSEKRKQEAREALKEAIGQWKDDQRITGLWELL